MLVCDLSHENSIELLTHLRLGRIACAQGSQPYVVPFYFAYQGNYLYSFSTVGQRIEWMRANPLVCVETDQIVSPEEWATLVIFGRYEELPDTPASKSEREFAFKLLQRIGVWWKPGYAKTVIAGVERPLVPLYFRIEIREISGHHAMPDPAGSVEETQSQRKTTATNSFRKLLDRVRAKS